MGKLKVFLSYHREFPVYKSDIFEPVQVGAALTDKDLGFIKDNRGDNISELNPYYCELTGHYYILKNYIDKCKENYIGFGHYRRILDITKISDAETPSIYGLNHTDSVKVFNSLEYSVLIENYDIILPCKSYMYKDTVNPILKDGTLTMYEQFKILHKNNLLDVLKEVLCEHFPEYFEAVNECYDSKKAWFYNIYIMKKEILKEFLTWEFAVLELIGQRTDSWDKYPRMAGFLGERLINIWLKVNNGYKLGYVPVYMVDFDSEYIKRANTFDYIGRYDLEIEELKELYEYASNKFSVSFGILSCYLRQNDFQNAKDCFRKAFYDCKSGGGCNKLAQMLLPFADEFKQEIIDCYEKSVLIEPDNKMFAKNFLVFSEKLHDIELIYQGWQVLSKHGLTEKEKEDFQQFMKCYEYTTDIYS